MRGPHEPRSFLHRCSPGVRVFLHSRRVAESLLRYCTEDSGHYGV